MVAALLTVLKVLGVLVLVVLALVILLALLVLFVPVRYSFCGEVHDPEGSTELIHLHLPGDVFFEGEVRWLAGALRAWAAAGGDYGKGTVRVRILGIRIPVEKLLKRKKRKEAPKEEKPREPAEKKSIEERIEAALQRVERLYARLEDALYALGTGTGLRAREVLYRRLSDLVETVLPARWGLTGVVGLGDPARSAKVFAVQGILYPVTAGHVSVGTEYDLYRYDLKGAAAGGVRLFSFVYAGIRIILNRDVRRLISRLRRGPSSGKNQSGQGHRYGDGKDKAARKKTGTAA